jgi:hypothetical protein
MQYCDHGPVWFGTLGVGDKPPYVEGLLISLPWSLGGSTAWPTGGCKSGWVHARVDSHPFMSSADPAHVRPWRGSFRGAWRSVTLLVFPCPSSGSMRCAGNFSSTGGTVSPARLEWVVRSFFTSFSHSVYRVVIFTDFPIVVVGRISTYYFRSRFPTHVDGPIMIQR